MVNPTGKKLEKLLFGIFEEAIQGVDRYKHNGSMWLIFTDDKKWVLEYTKEQTLWYNYYFFKQEMDMVGSDCVENKDFIQKWFEYRFLNKKRVKDTIQNGVKNTRRDFTMDRRHVENIIQNGVKYCEDGDWLDGDERFEDIIQNGVKQILDDDIVDYKKLEDTIQNGIEEK